MLWVNCFVTEVIAVLLLIISMREFEVTSIWSSAFVNTMQDLLQCMNALLVAFMGALGGVCS